MQRKPGNSLEQGKGFRYVAERHIAALVLPSAAVHTIPSWRCPAHSKESAIANIMPWETQPYRSMRLPAAPIPTQPQMLQPQPFDDQWFPQVR